MKGLSASGVENVEGWLFVVSLRNWRRRRTRERIFLPFARATREPASEPDEDRWSAATAISVVNEYADAARAKGKAVETIYIEGADDLMAFSPNYWTPDLMSKVAEFIRK